MQSLTFQSISHNYCFHCTIFFSLKLKCSVNYMIHVFLIFFGWSYAWYIYYMYTNHTYIHTPPSGKNQFLYTILFEIWVYEVSLKIFCQFLFSTFFMLSFECQFSFFRGLLLTLKFLPIIKYIISFFKLCKKKSVKKWYECCY